MARGKAERRGMGVQLRERLMRGCIGVGVEGHGLYNWSWSYPPEIGRASCRERV